jgi:hypothetical protein
MDYRHKPPRRGVNFGRRLGVNIQRRLTGQRIAGAGRLAGGLRDGIHARTNSTRHEFVLRSVEITNVGEDDARGMAEKRNR